MGQVRSRPRAEPSRSSRAAALHCQAVRRSQEHHQENLGERDLEDDMMIGALKFSIPQGRVRCPWTGIPVPGKRPLVLNTEKLRGALAGVDVSDAVIIETPRAANSKRGEAVRALEV